MAHTATGYSYVQRKQITKAFTDPVEAICSAIEIMGEGDRNAGVIGPDQRFYNHESWDLLRHPKAYAASL